MQQYILKYLLQHQRVSIEGWGTMQLVSESAQVDFTNRKVNAPAVSILFHETVTTDNSFENWLTQELNISYHDAVNAVKSFVQTFQKAISNTPLQWNGWGSFETINNKIIFKPAFNVFPAAVTAERVIRKGAEHQIRVGEDERTNTQMEEWLHGSTVKQKYLWWMAGLVLLGFGIILAVLFANQHNIQWKKYTNYHQLQPKEPPVLYKTP